MWSARPSVVVAVVNLLHAIAIQRTDAASTGFTAEKANSSVFMKDSQRSGPPFFDFGADEFDRVPGMVDQHYLPAMGGSGLGFDQPGVDRYYLPPSSEADRSNGMMEMGMFPPQLQGRFQGMPPPPFMAGPRASRDVCPQLISRLQDELVREPYQIRLRRFAAGPQSMDFPFLTAMVFGLREHSIEDCWVSNGRLSMRIAFPRLSVDLNGRRPFMGYDNHLDDRMMRPNMQVTGAELNVDFDLCRGILLKLQVRDLIRRGRALPGPSRYQGPQMPHPLSMNGIRDWNLPNDDRLLFESLEDFFSHLSVFSNGADFRMRDPNICHNLRLRVDEDIKQELLN